MSILPGQVEGEWSSQEAQLHIDVLEFWSIHLAMAHFTHSLRSIFVAVVSDNTMALTYLDKAGGTRSEILNQETYRLLRWTELNDVEIGTCYLQGEKNVVMDLVETHFDTCFTNLVTPFTDSMAVATNAFLYGRDHQDLYAFLPYAVVREALDKLRSSRDTSLKRMGRRFSVIPSLRL